MIILKIFKIVKYYIKNYKWKIFLFINYNNFFNFINIKIQVLNKFTKPKKFLILLFNWLLWKKTNKIAKKFLDFFKKYNWLILLINYWIKLKKKYLI